MPIRVEGQVEIGDRERAFVREFIKQELMEGIAPEHAPAGPAARAERLGAQQRPRISRASS